jgi:hypothetical protein
MAFYRQHFGELHCEVHLIELIDQMMSPYPLLPVLLMHLFLEQQFFEQPPVLFLRFLT